MQGAQALQTGLTAIVEETREYDLAQAKVRAQSQLTRLETEHAGKEFYTSDEIRALGLEDAIDIPEEVALNQGTTQVTQVPREEVYPLLMERAFDDATEANTVGIRNDQDRAQYYQDMSVAREGAMLKVYTQTRQAAMERKHKEMEIGMAEARADGNFVGERELARMRYKDPALLQERLDEIDVAEADAYYNNAQINYTPEAMDAEADKLAATPLDETPYDSDERAAKVKDLRTGAKRKRKDVDSRSKAAMDQFQETSLADLQDRMNRGEQLSWSQDFYPLTTNPLADEAYITKMNGLYTNYNTTGSPYAKADQYDLAAYTEMNRMVSDPNVPLKEAHQYLTANQSKLTATQASQFSQALADRDDPQTQPGMMSATALTDVRLKSIGINPGQTTDKPMMQQVAGFQSMVNNALSVAKAANNGKPLSQDQINTVVDSIFINVKPREREIFGLNDKGTNVFGLILDGEGDAGYNTMLLQIENQLRQTPGARYTPDEYYAVYLDIKDAEK